MGLRPEWNSRDSSTSLRYIAPFVIFLALITLGAIPPFNSTLAALFRLVLLAVVCVVCWPPELSIAPRYPLTTIAIGAAVFVLWIAPDLAFPGYRKTILFSNAIVGHLHSSLGAEALQNPWMLSWRTLRAIVIVPVVEELFWRGWLMRWLINADFQKVPLGAYTPFSFWITAILFASEHGPYWDVGLITGLIYNAWMIRTKSVSSCILMHAVTNAVLSAYVISYAQWQYWQ